MDTIIIKANKKQSKIVREFLETQKVKFDITPKKKGKDEGECPYDPEFVERILKSSQQAKEGKYTIISVEDLWK
ncbi:MAG: hypothetical protein KA270_09130 [Saprospiraceae bacterium]|jgi:hypothetical protein|nr:hypothetical protein [Saprospiraceae bacterium]MBP6237098.1 hypothetical protein [Saprospiraceae bacterium]MBP6567316.1 hypothetical protein [Saprospiraceae bacterium]MBP9197561.1 hypothetical protein [Saprospiraceae bacterium]